MSIKDIPTFPYKEVRETLKSLGDDGGVFGYPDNWDGFNHRVLIALVRKVKELERLVDRE